MAKGLVDLLQQKNKRLSSVPEKLLTSVEKVQKRLIKKILDVVDKLDVADGSIRRTKRNLTLISSISEEIKQLLLNSEYVPAVKEFIKEFDTQAEMTDQYLGKEFDVSKTSAFADASLEKVKRQTVKYLLEAPLDTAFITPIEELLINSVNSGASFVETIKSIRDFVEGAEDANGKLLQYSKQIAYDSFAISDRAYTSTRAEELDLQFFIYAGGELPTTRPFCEARREKVFHRKEIESWVTTNGSHESNPVPHGDEWAGRINGTNESTIFNFAGGHNCRHSINPISIASVPEDVIQRNIESGNYEPSEAEQEILGL